MSGLTSQSFEKDDFLAMVSRSQVADLGGTGKDRTSVEEEGASESIRAWGSSSTLRLASASSPPTSVVMC